MDYLQSLLLSQFVFGMNPSKVNFDQEKIRSHLIQCLEIKLKKKKCDFPFNINSAWKIEKKKKKPEGIHILEVQRAV